MKKSILLAVAFLTSVSMYATDLFTGSKYVSWDDGGLQIEAAQFANAEPGQKIVVNFTGATDGIEFKVLDDYHHIPGSREAAWINGDGVYEQFLTAKAVDDIQANGLEIIGANFTITKVELLDGKSDLKEGYTVWTGFFWADNWTTLELYAEGYNSVDFSKVSAIRFYSEAVGTNLSSFGEGAGSHGGVWECPELIRLPVISSESSEDKWVLLVSINPGGPFGGSATQYFVGEWDGREFVPESSDMSHDSSEAQWLDYGKDNYSTFTFHNSPDGRVVSLGWMSNWQYANQLPTVTFRSQNTIARDLSLYKDDTEEYRIIAMPSLEYKAFYGEKTDCLSDAAIVELELDGKQDAVITLSNNKGEKVIMTMDVHRQTFSMDRTASGDCSFSHDFAANTTTPLFKQSDEHHITLFIDHCSIEAFGTDGTWAMTNLVFPSEPYNHIDVEGGKATIYEINF